MYYVVILVMHSLRRTSGWLHSNYELLNSYKLWKLIFCGVSTLLQFLATTNHPTERRYREFSG